MKTPENNYITLTIAITTLLLGFAAGLETGSQNPTTYELDYDYIGSQDLVIQKYPFPPEKQVNYTGTIKVNDLTVHFRTPEQDPKFEGGRIGYTYSGGKKEIWLQTGREAKDMEAICDHEVFHEFFPDFNHPEGPEKFSDPIYKYSDDARILECDAAVKAALDRQG